jgi:putative tricarboxylic transport membrane protein
MSIYGSTQLGLGSLREPGAGFLTFLAGALISLMAMIVFFQSFLKDQGPQVRLSALWEGVNWHRPILISLLTLGYILLLERLGFLITSFLLLIVILKGLENFVWKKALLIPALTVGISYLLFNFLLKVTLPKGPFGF